VIIQIRGTSGSGKSTAMRAVMDSMFWDAVRVEGRKKPLYYFHSHEGHGDGWPNIALLGHYESPCGGCDTIGSARAVYELIQNLLQGGGDITHVLCEGLLLSEDTKWTKMLVENSAKDAGPPVRVLFLTTPLEECLSRIKQRREGVGNNDPLNPENTSRRVAVIERARVKLEESGAYVRRCSSRQAPEIVLRWLRES
jgi:hypothetical protein